MAAVVPAVHLPSCSPRISWCSRSNARVHASATSSSDDDDSGVTTGGGAPSRMAAADSGMVASAFSARTSSTASPT